MSLQKPGPIRAVSPTDNSFVQPRLLRIVDAANYLSCTYTWIETLIREKTVRSVIQGKRRLIDRNDLDSYIERIKSEQNAA